MDGIIANSVQLNQKYVTKRKPKKKKKVSYDMVYKAKEKTGR